MSTCLHFFLLLHPLFLFCFFKTQMPFSFCVTKNFRRPLHYFCDARKEICFIPVMCDLKGMSSGIPCAVCTYLHDGNDGSFQADVDCWEG